MRVRLRLPVLRAERRMTQSQLAHLAGVRPDTISALEREKTGGIQFDTLARLCEVLRCEPGDLFELEPDEHEVPVLGGPDEDEIILQRLREPGRTIDGPTFLAELLNTSAKPETHERTLTGHGR